MLIFSFAQFGCDPSNRPSGDLPAPAVDVGSTNGQHAAQATSPQDARAQATNPAAPAANDADAGDAAAATQLRDAVFAGGCFWCTEAVFAQLKGVSDVVSGYTGGDARTANYQAVGGGGTDHAEAVRITYDPAQITYGKLLQVFFETHNPTQLNAQGPDRGRQYRSAVFFANEEERAITEAYIKQLTDAGVYTAPIVTTLEPLTTFYVAEDYHQDYAARNPYNGYIQQQAAPKVEKTRKKFKDLLKD